ncbi:MAG: carboxypeptidase-like regulatory domain-containing protein [Acidobacteriota bacterium]
MKLAVFISSGAVAALVAQYTPASGAVEGTVVNTVTRAGIGGVTVVFATVQSNEEGAAPSRYEATSDAAGRFRIAAMAPGDYRASAEMEGFTSPMTIPDLSVLMNSVLRVTTGGAVLKVELKLTPFTTLAGRVVDPDGKPAAGVQVSLAPNVMANEVVTDEEGRFALENNKPGSYTLIAKPPQSAKQEQAGDGTRTALVTTYYPSVADRSLAQPIVVGGQDFGGYEIRMQTAAVHRVRGIVLDEEGKPSSGAEVALFGIQEGTRESMALSARLGGSILFALGMRRAPSGTPELNVIAGNDGRFEFSAVRSGDWILHAASDPIRDGQTRGGISSRGAGAVFVGRADLEDFQIRIARPFDLKGTLEWKGDAPGPQRDSDPRLFAAVFLMSEDGNEYERVGILESGELSFENILPGRYRIIAKPGATVQTFLGESEVVGPFSATAGGPRLRVVLKSFSGTVRGIVEKGEGSTVVLIPRRVEGVTLGQTVVCGAGGSFELSEVSPGDYYIAAFERVGGLSPLTAILGLMPSRGTSVRVDEHSTANVMLSLIAAPR